MNAKNLCPKCQFDFCKVFCIFGIISFIAMIFVHRRVIKSVITGSPMPECPHNRCGCKKSEDG